MQNVGKRRDTLTGRRSSASWHENGSVSPTGDEVPDMTSPTSTDAPDAAWDDVNKLVILGQMHTFGAVDIDGTVV